MRRLLLAVVVLLVLAVGADRLAASYTASRISRELTAQGASSARAQVHGFPFLTQAAARRLQQVDLGAQRVTGLSDVPVEDVQARLEGVRLVGAQRARADDLDAQATVPYREVESRLRLPSGSLSTSGDGKLRISRRVDVLGARLDAVATADVGVADGQLKVTPTGAQLVPGGAVPAGLLRSLTDTLRFSYPLQGLPQGTRVESVVPVGGGLRVHLVGRDVLLQR